LIHADLAGNVLFADSLPPAVIDALTWRGARPALGTRALRGADID
jgi:hypothetical protein